MHVDPRGRGGKEKDGDMSGHARGMDAMRRRTIGEVTAAVAGEDGVGSFPSSFICSLGVVQMQFGLYVSNEIHGLNEINLEVKYTIFTTWQPFSAAGAQQQRTRVTRQKRAQ